MSEPATTTPATAPAAGRATAQTARVAVVGTGYWGKNLVRNFHALGALAAICDSDGATLEALSAQYPGCATLGSCAEALRDPAITALAIATPAETHGDLVREALLAGKDVLVEKPLCLDVAEGERLVALARERKRILMVGHLLWYHPAVLKLHELVLQGELGRLQYIYSTRLNLGKIRREENILWSFAPHDISVILGLVGETPERVEAEGGNYLHRRIADVTMTVLAFPSGVRAHSFVSWLHPYKEQKLVVVGDRKMAVFDDVEKQDKLVLYPHSIEWRNHAPVPSRAEAQPVALEWQEPLRAECQHFLDCAATRQRPRTDGAEALRVLSVLQRCQAALERETTAASAPTAPPAAAPSKPAPAPARPYFAHESAFIDEGVEIGEGTTIWHVSHILKDSRVGKNCRIGQNVVIGPAVTVGDNVKIQNNVSVYEGVTLEDHVFCGPSMVFTNVFNPRSEIRRMDEVRPTLVRRGASLGANSTIICGVTIGRYAFVGAGALVLKDVPDFALLVGNPGRVIGWMCRCGNRIEFTADNSTGACKACGQAYRRAGQQVREA